MPYSLIVRHPAQNFADLFLRALHGTFLMLGFVVSLLIGASLVADELPFSLHQTGNRDTATNVADQTSVSGESSAGASVNPAGNLQQVASAIARRYRVAQPAIEDIVRIAESSAQSAKIDPLLVLAIIGIESRFNPYSESPFGAQGLMQIIGRFHTDKYTPTADGQALLDPETNIRVGVAVLRDYLRRTGDINAALKLYGGESDESGIGYADKVLSEKDRLQQVILRGRKA